MTVVESGRNVATVLNAQRHSGGGNVGNLSLTINANQTTGTATPPTVDEDDTVDGSVAGFSVTATTVTISDNDTPR